MNVNNEKPFHPRELHDYVGGLDGGGVSMEEGYSEWINKSSSPTKKKYTQSVFPYLIIGLLIGSIIALIILFAYLTIAGMKS